MPLSRSRDYFSISEVLEAVQADFPDVSISKIRFLESEGLIAPERTSSGYRKFYEPDVARLRYILSLQRDHFLPLKIIRERLAEADSNGGAYPKTETPAPRGKAPKAKARGGLGRAAEQMGDGGLGAEQPTDVTGVSLSRAELQKAAGLNEEQMKGLEEFGVLEAKEPGAVYDGADLMVAGAAAKFFNYGVEPRHLRMYRQFADRESAFFEQIVMPIARRRDSEGQKVAAQSLHELAGLARRMREGMMQSSLRGRS